jgi:hypothetical protein
MLCEYERESISISECIIGIYFTLNVFGAGFDPLCIEMYLNDVEINK